MRIRSGLLLAVAVAMATAGCAVPPPEAYLQGGGSRVSERSIDLGRNSVGEACVYTPSSGPVTDIYCGAWQQPSGHVRAGGRGDMTVLAAAMTDGPWRKSIDNNYLCGTPRGVTMAGSPALQMDCTGKVGGWPYAALGIVAGGSVWLADGVVSAVPAIDQSVAVLSGQQTGKAVSSASVLAQQAERTGQQALATGDSRQYDLLMSQGAQANLVDNPVAAETAYGAALAVQEKALGKDNPNLAEPLMHLALQLSNEGRYGEADAQFRRAETLTPRQRGDETLASRLQYYEALHALNQTQYQAALDKLGAAQAGFQRFADPAQFRPPTAVNAFNAALEGVMTTPDEQLKVQALIGLVETWRSEAEVLQAMHRPAESLAKLRQANALVRNARLTQPRVTARLRRAEALAEAAAGQNDSALANFATSTADFRQAYPSSRPLALIGLLNAKVLMEHGDSANAIAACRASVQVLGELKSGYPPERIAPCLDAFAAEAAKATGATRQDILAQMFIAVQLVRSSQTEQQISQASARLGAGRDGKVAAAIRDQQDAATALATIRRREAEATAAAKAGESVRKSSGPSLAEQEQVAVAALAEKERALQAAAPNFGQLVQQVTPASDILALLEPGEAFASITLTRTTGWTFLLRQGTIDVARVSGGSSTIDALVTRIREAMTPETPAFDTGAAQTLYTDLFGPLQAQMAGLKALTVAPTGSLLALPFEVLLTGPADPAKLTGAPWMARQVAIGHVPSAGNFVSLRKIAGVSQAPSPWFGFGDFRRVSLAQARQSFGPACGDSAQLLAQIALLPSAKQELSAAAKIMGASPGDELLGDSFTVPGVQRTDLARYRVLHFASHALLPTDLKCQTEAAIITSPVHDAKDASSALLTASDLTELKLDADLVILSACNSGGSDGQLTGGESLSALARSFFYGGARGMMITHWEVNDQAAAVLIPLTLQKMRENPEAGTAAALQAAQQEWLERAVLKNPEYAHPYYWAPFALIGQAGRPIAATRTAARL